MTGLLAFLFLISLGVFCWGMIHPRSLAKLHRKELGRRHFGLGYGLVALGLFIGVGITAPPQPSKSDSIQLTNARHATASNTPASKPVAPKAAAANSSATLAPPVVTTVPPQPAAEPQPAVQPPAPKTVAPPAPKPAPAPAAKPAAPAPKPATPAPAPAPAPANTYTNVDGNTIESPSANPAGATGVCTDGTYTHAVHHQGACSGHGGVSRWL